MGKYSFYISFIFLVLCSTLSAMKAPLVIEEVNPTIGIYNGTPDRILAYYLFIHQEPAAPVVIAPQKGFELGRLDQLRSLKIAIYGKYREWLTSQKLSAGLMQLEELTPKIHSGQLHYPGRSLVLTVALKKPWLGLISPYDFLVGPPSSFIKEKPSPHTIWANFPLAEIAKEKRLIEPHMILALPKEPSKDDIEKAYRRDEQRWRSKRASANTDDAKKEAKLAIELIDAAYNSLKQDNMHTSPEFRSLVDRELAKSAYTTYDTSLEEIKP